MAQVIDNGSDTYVATCVGTSRVAAVPQRAKDPVNEKVRRDTARSRSARSVATLSGDRNEQEPWEKDPAADLLQRVKDAVSPRAIRRRWQYRNYLP